MHQDHYKILGKTLGRIIPFSPYHNLLSLFGGFLLKSKIGFETD